MPTNTGLSVVYSLDLDGVNWAEAKAALAEDDFDNGRSSGQLQLSFENSYRCCNARVDGRLVGMARILSDGVCNAYLVDVWTRLKYRRQGIGHHMVTLLMEQIPGQHIGLFTENNLSEFYRNAGFIIYNVGFEKIVGEWLNGGTPPSSKD